MIKREWARDVVSLGSIFFYLLVVARALIGPFRPFIDQLIIAAIVLTLISIFYRKYDGYSCRGLILLFFTISFYNSFRFDIFAMFIFLVLVFSSYILGNKMREIAKGLAIGALCITIAYFLALQSIALF